MALLKILVLGTVISMLLLQLELLFHISQPLLYRRELLNWILSSAFTITFLISLWLAYEILRLKQLITHYIYHSYKKNDDFQQEVKVTTRDQLKKLMDSEKFKDWSRRGENQPPAHQLNDVEQQKFFSDIDNAIFGEESFTEM